MRVRKGVITAAGRGVGLYPAVDTVQRGMLPIVDRDGLTKPILQVIAEEALDSGIEELCVVCAPGDEERYRVQFGLLRDNLLGAFRGVNWADREVARIEDLVKRVCFAVQDEPRGYGDAVLCAGPFVGSEPFLLLLSDHVYRSRLHDKRCAQQLIDLAEEVSAPVSAVHATREHLIGRYGTLSGRRVSDRPGVYQIERILEKPAVSRAELELQTPGLRAGHYLCFFGMHVLVPQVLALLEEDRGRNGGNNGNLQLTPALDALARREQYLALEVEGSRYDIGAKLGHLQAQVALALSGRDRAALLSTVLELLAEASQDSDASSEA